MNKNGDKINQKEVLECFQAIGLLGPNFRELRIKQVRKYCRAVAYSHAEKNIQKCLQILMKNATGIQDMLKILMFCHIIIQQGEQLSSEGKQLIVDRINDTLGLMQDTLKKKKKPELAQSAILSVQKTVNWLKDRISRSKEKKPIRTRKNSDFSREERSRVASTQGDGSPKNNSSKEQYLFYNLVTPYASFLQKLINSKIIQSPELVKIKKEDVWKSINLFKAMLKVTNIIVPMLRYYMQQYMELVISLIKIVDYDVKMKYPITDIFLRNIFTQLEKEHKRIMELNLPDHRTHELNDELIDKFELQETRNIIDELSEVNEGILQIYYGRYHFNRLQIQGINCVKLTKASSQFQLIYRILKSRQKIQRSKEKSIRKENSRIQHSSSTLQLKEKIFQNRKSLKLVIDKCKPHKQEEVAEPNTPIKAMSTPSTEGRTQQTETQAPKQPTQNQISQRFKLLRQMATQEQHHKKNKLKL